MESEPHNAMFGPQSLWTFVCSNLGVRIDQEPELYVLRWLKKNTYLLQGIHANSSYKRRFKNRLLMNYTLLLFYLIRKRCLPKFQIFFSICQNSLQGTSQKFLIEILGCPHQGWERHGHLHFHSGKVLQQRNYYYISTTWKYCNSLLQHQCSDHCTLLLTDTWYKRENTSFVKRTVTEQWLQ